MEAQLRVQRVYEPLDARVRGICSRFEPLQPQGIVASSEPHNVLDHTTSSTTRSISKEITTCHLAISQSSMSTFYSLNQAYPPGNNGIACEAYAAGSYDWEQSTSALVTRFPSMSCLRCRKMALLGLFVLPNQLFLVVTSCESGTLTYTTRSSCSRRLTYTELCSSSCHIRFLLLPQEEPFGERYIHINLPSSR